MLTSHNLSAQRYWNEFLIDNWLILFPVFIWVNLIFDFHCSVRFDPCLLQNKLDWGVSLSQCRARFIFEGVKVKFRNWEFTKPGARQLWNQYWIKETYNRNNIEVPSSWEALLPQTRHAMRKTTNTNGLPAMFYQDGGLNNSWWISNVFLFCFLTCQFLTFMNFSLFRFLVISSLAHGSQNPK